MHGRWVGGRPCTLYPAAPEPKPSLATVARSPLNGVAEVTVIHEIHVTSCEPPYSLVSTHIPLAGCSVDLSRAFLLAVFKARAF